MKRHLVIAIAVVYVALSLVGAQAVALGIQKPIVIVVELGTKSGDFVITPSELKFQRGKLYKLIVRNPSPFTHYFSAPRFDTAVWTAKVNVRGGEVNPTESQNPEQARLDRLADAFLYEIQQIEVRPGGTAVWTFMPVLTGSYPFGCTIPAHNKAGMVGNILIN